MGTILPAYSIISSICILELACSSSPRYPIDVFPPTDYHTSTYFADSTLGKEYIFIIGGLGYLGDASRDQTAVHRLDLSDFSMQRLETSGAGPSGGTHGHKAELIGIDNQPVINITKKEGEKYVLRLRDLTWIQYNCRELGNAASNETKLQRQVSAEIA